MLLLETSVIDVSSLFLAQPSSTMMQQARKKRKENERGRQQKNMMAKAEKTFYAVAPFPLSGAAISPKKKKFGGGEIQKDGEK